MRRLRSLDLVRGGGIMTMVFLHGAVYHYAGLFDLDFANPPLIVTLLGFLLMWAGLFAVMSGATHAIRITERLRQGVPVPRLLRWEVLGAAGLLGLGLVYFTLVGPSILVFETRSRVDSLAIGLIRDGTGGVPELSRWVYMHTLFTIGMTTLCAGPMLLWLARRNDPQSRRVRAILAAAALTVFALSWLRIPLYPLFERALAEGNLGVVLATFWLLNKNAPLFPALGFALCGTLLGLAIAAEGQRRPMALPLLLGGGLVLAGVAAALVAPDTMLERSIDWTWYSIMLAQGGVVLLGLVAAHRWLDRPGRGGRPPRDRPGAVEATLNRFGRASLTVLLGETLLAEAASRGLSALAPGWNGTLGAALAFGAASVAVWAAILWAWERQGYRGSVEWLWVRAMARLHRPSTRLEGMRGGDGHGSGTAAGYR